MAAAKSEAVPANVAIGIDIGGSGIKLARVDLEKGELIGKRKRVETPQPATPAAVSAALKSMLSTKIYAGIPFAGSGFPAAIKDGRPMTAANIDPSWIGVDARALLSEAAGRPLVVLNDADAAGIAEVRFGAGKGVMGEVMMITLGTGIGTGMFVDGRLVPNTELGHLEIRGKDAETRASAAAKTRRHLSWKAWAALIQEYLATLDRLFFPDLFIIGGGVSATPERFLPYLKTRCPIVPASMGNNAGIIGAALYAADAFRETPG